MTDKRTVITVDGNGMLSIPSNLQDLWMSEGELVDMLHVTAMKLHLGAEKGNARYTFYGYMIGVGNAKGDIINFDFEEVPTGYAKKLTRSAGGSANTFGKASGIRKMTGAEKKLNDRR